MDGKENEEKSDARTLQKRTAATASNAAKRELMGDEAYLLEKRGWRKRKAERAAAAATSATAQPQPPPTDIVGKLSELAKLRSQGFLDEDEFKAAKARVLVATSAATADGPPAASPQPQPAYIVHRGTKRQKTQIVLRVRAVTALTTHTCK